MDLATALYDRQGAPYELIVCDLRSADGVQYVHTARAKYQERTDLIGLGPDHLLLVVALALFSDDD